MIGYREGYMIYIEITLVMVLNLVTMFPSFSTCPGIRSCHISLLTNLKVGLRLD